MEIPLDEVANTAMTSKTEVSVEFKLPTAEQMVEDRDLKRGDQLVEMRFFIPATTETDINNTTSANENGDTDVQSPTVVNGDDDELSAASVYHYIYHFYHCCLFVY
jgi:structure-specific recognition protein 1